MLKQKHQKAFTLIELLIVIAIIGLLASIVLVSLNSARSKARDAKRKADLRNMTTALEFYYNEYGVYPPFRASNTCGGSRPDFATSYCSDSNWLSTDANLLNYVSRLPRDPINSLGQDDSPWWQAYTYTYGVTADGKFYDLLGELENTSDPDRCAVRQWISVAVWPNSVCWSSGVLPRSAQIFSPK
jgi:prepilin-type N-terminal cleavage/methylation domain-containing protein